MNMSNYLSHINCFIKDFRPRVSSISTVQLASVFRTEPFSRSLILYRDNDTSCYSMIVSGFYALNSTEVLALLEYLEAILLDVFIPPGL